MSRVTVKVAVIDEHCMVDESTAQEFTCDRFDLKKDDGMPLALYDAMTEAQRWMREQHVEHGHDSFDLTVAL